MRRKFICLAWFTLLALTVSGVQLDLQGPILIQEPPHIVEFANSAGGRIDCQANGVPNPKIEWILADSSSITQIPDIRVVLSNGSLLFPPFPPEDFRHDVHTKTYRCVARNQVGLILSRDVIVKAVVAQKYEIQVYDEYVISGNTAVLRCQVPSYVADHVLITSWMQDGLVHIYPTTDTGGKYAVLKTGDLYVFNAGPSDGYKTYSCRTVNKLTGEAHSSAYAARLIITEAKERAQPRATVEKHSTRKAKLGEELLLPCVAQGYPVPSYKWFKEDREQLVPINANERLMEIAEGLLYISKVRLEDQGKYICWVNNSVGEETIQVNLVVTAPLSAHIQPSSQIVDVGKEAVFVCIHGGFPVLQTVWYHNGKKIFQGPRHTIKASPERLIIRPVEKEDHGMYQCFIKNEWDEAQATTELQLGDASPELLTWFSEQTLKPGPSLSLKCSATGNPPPHFVWTLDGFPIPDSTRFMVGQYITVNDDVISHVNISTVKEEDGGEYTCAAKNTIAQVSHSAKINIYGLPFIRVMPKVAAVAGNDLIIKCPVAGYPVETVTWEKAGVTLPINRRQRVYNNGTLIIEQVQRDSDAGSYTCQAKNKQNYSARRNVQLDVLVPPKILPMQSMKGMLREGMRAALTCQVIEGDLPFQFRWEKDNLQITGSSVALGIATRRNDAYSSTLVIDSISPKHTANYTCFAENLAGVDNFTVPLTVNVPPRWQVEPSDTNVAAGHDVMLNCQAVGYPEPTIIWKKSIGEFVGEYKDFLYESNVNFFPNGSLKFVKIVKENEGHYLCEAKNGIGSGVSKLVFLKVNVPAHFPQKYKQLQIIKGEQAHMQCSAVGDKPIDIVWKMNGQRIYGDKDARYMIREQRLDEGMVSELGISHTYRHDSGTLICYASNTFGQDEMKIELIIQEIPEVPKNIRVNDQQSRSLQVAWTQPYDGNTPITGYIIQYKLLTEEWEKHPSKIVVPGTQTLATIKDLHPASSYHIRIIAENRLGKSEPSEVIQVITQEEAPSGPPYEIIAEPKTSTEIIITWKAPQREQWNGNLLGYYVGYREQTPTNPPVPVTSTNNYNFKTVELGVQYGGETNIGGLDKFTTYAVIVQAYNSKGAGPPSTPVFVRTKEDVPSSPPENVNCNTLGSQSLEVTWEPPNTETQHGILLGFKVSYEPVEENYGKEEIQTKITTAVRTQIPGLLKYSNYSITVLSYTSAGDGAKSNAVFCRTGEDVPSAPSEIKAALSSFKKIQVSWLPPLHKNGVVVVYNFYMSTIEDGKEKGTSQKELGPESEYYEVERKELRATYQFWVTASTKVGEGESSRVVTVSPSNKVPARIMSFSRHIVTPWKRDLNLTCRKVGDPIPQTTWKLEEKVMETNGRKKINKEGALIITDIQKADEGNYTCNIENLHGRDEVIYSLVVEVPPDRPKLVVAGATTDSIHLEWEVGEKDKSNILGYVINYKRDHGDWEELQLEAKLNSYILQNLWCATRYQLYITAFNKIGTGLPCDIVNGYTKGSVPVRPRNNHVLVVNATSASIRVDSWQDGGCPILYFIVEYQNAEQNNGWLLATNNLQPNDRVYVISDLKPAVKYNVKVTAHNNAGSTVGLYNFTTMTVNGVTMPPTEESELQLSDDVPFYFNLKIVIIVFVLSIVLSTLIAILVFLRRKKMMEKELETLGESPSVAQIQNEQNRDQQYLAIRARERALQSETDRIKQNPDQYMDDICPYATFQISKSPYPESTYSGNVYSGPYSSVKGSFLYHGSKNNADTYKLKHYNNSEYSKVRRKCGKLRDPHSESQESDNLGSTDSEVKKILSLHMPIREYDTLGSDSEGEMRSSQKGGNQELSSFRHRAGSRDLIKSGEEDSSSSSETSPNGGRKHFHMRKSKSKGQSGNKRHVRSSSGYSSHTEETTFSSHPSGKLSDLHSQSHDLDTLEFDKLHAKRRSSKSSVTSSRFNRDNTFQIDV